MEWHDFYDACSVEMSSPFTIEEIDSLENVGTVNEVLNVLDCFENEPELDHFMKRLEALRWFDTHIHNPEELIKLLTSLDSDYAKQVLTQYAMQNRIQFLLPSFLRFLDEIDQDSNESYIRYFLSFEPALTSKDLGLLSNRIWEETEASLWSSYIIDRMRSGVVYESEDLVNLYRALDDDTYLGIFELMIEKGIPLSWKQAIEIFKCVDVEEYEKPFLGLISRNEPIQVEEFMTLSTDCSISDQEMIALIQLADQQKIALSYQELKTICTCFDADVLDLLFQNVMRQGMKFSAKQILELEDDLSEDVLLEAIRHMEGMPTKKQVHQLGEFLDQDDLLEAASERFPDLDDKLEAIIFDEEEILDEEEMLDAEDDEMGSNGMQRKVTWEEVYENYDEWEDDVLLKKIELLSDIGPSAQIAEIVDYISEECALKLQKKALNMGVVFSVKEIIQMIDSYDENEMTSKMLDIAVKKNLPFTYDDLEYFDDGKHDAMIKKIDKKQNLHYLDDPDDEDQDEYEEDYEDYGDGKKARLLDNIATAIVVNEGLNWLEKRRKEKEERKKNRKKRW